jgi:hypothetical protein
MREAAGMAAKEPEMIRDCKFCGGEFMVHNANHEFCSPTCRDKFNKIGRPLSELHLINIAVMDASYGGRGGYQYGGEPLAHVVRMLSTVLPEDNPRLWLNDIQLTVNCIEEFGSRFEDADLKAIADLELACERLARRAQRQAALLKQARLRAEVLMKTQRAIDRTSNIVALGGKRS